MNLTFDAPAVRRFNLAISVNEPGLSREIILTPGSAGPEEMGILFESIETNKTAERISKK